MFSGLFHPSDLFYRFRVKQVTLYGSCWHRKLVACTADMMQAVEVKEVMSTASDDRGTFREVMATVCPHQR